MEWSGVSILMADHTLPPRPCLTEKVFFLGSPSGWFRLDFIPSLTNAKPYGSFFLSLGYLEFSDLGLWPNIYIDLGCLAFYPYKYYIISTYNIRFIIIALISSSRISCWCCFVLFLLHAFPTTITWHYFTVFAFAELEFILIPCTRTLWASCVCYILLYWAGTANPFSFFSFLFFSFIWFYWAPLIGPYKYNGF